MRQPLSTHIVAALVLSFGLSILFWLGFGVFVLVGFILWSLVCAAVGAGAGYFLAKNNILVTAAVTIVLRVAIYLIMTQAA